MSEELEQYQAQAIIDAFTAPPEPVKMDIDEIEYPKFYTAKNYQREDAPYWSLGSGDYVRIGADGRIELYTTCIMSTINAERVAKALLKAVANDRTDGEPLSAELAKMIEEETDMVLEALGDIRYGSTMQFEVMTEDERGARLPDCYFKKCIKRLIWKVRNRFGWSIQAEVTDYGNWVAGVKFTQGA